MPKSMRAALLGHPVRHSLSPVIYKCLSERVGCNLLYEIMDIEPSSLVQCFNECKRGSYVGLNLTIPYKERVLPLLSDLSPEACAIGAVNTIRFEGKKAIGYNTDAYGIEMALRSGCVKIRSNKILIFGAGGAARAMAYVAGSDGADSVFVLNRSYSRGEALCAHFNNNFPNTKFIPVGSARDVRENIYLCVNATPVGMIGIPYESPLQEIADTCSMVFDMIYNPSRTTLMKSAEHRGIDSIGGLDMLIWQAFGAWEIWFGEIDGKHEMHKDIKDILIASY